MKPLSGGIGRFAPVLCPGGLLAAGGRAGSGGAGGTGPGWGALPSWEKRAEKRQKGQRPAAVRRPRGAPGQEPPLRTRSVCGGSVRAPRGAGLAGGLCCGRNRDRPGGGEWPGFCTLAQGLLQVGFPHAGGDRGPGVYFGLGLDPWVSGQLPCVRHAHPGPDSLGSSYWILWGGQQLCPRPRPRTGPLAQSSSDILSKPHPVEELLKMGQEVIRFT